MKLDEFWDHIEAASRDDAEAQVEKLVDRLADLPPDEIIDFAYWWQTKLCESYGRSLWGAAYLINGGCSDDGFQYFREWLLLQGRDVFQAAVADPDSLAEVLDGEEVEHECYPAMRAWFRATGTAEDDAGYAALRAAERARHPSWPRFPELGEGWDFDDDDEMRSRYPRLAAMYGCGD